MQSNFQMYLNLIKVFHPQTRGFVTEQEMQLIENVLHLKEMDGLQLQNLRDFVVLAMSDHDPNEDYAVGRDRVDRMSAIVFVIDMALSKAGCLV